MNIRKESVADIDAIYRLTARAFAPMPFSEGTEPDIINALRKDGNLTLSLIAEENGVIIGQITFSPVTINGEHEDWFGLGPVSVSPERQGQYIGSALINAGLDWLRNKKANGCALIGNPDYYCRFGFRKNMGLSYGDLDNNFVQKLVLAGPDKDGELEFCSAFATKKP